MKPILSLILAALIVRAEAQPFSFAQKAAPRFQYELANLAASDSTLSRLLLGISILQGDLSFMPVAQGFEAEYRISLAIVNAGGDTVAAHQEEARLRVETLAETHSRQKYAFHRFDFNLPPGQYVAHLTLLDRASHLHTQAIAAKQLRDFGAANSTLVVSDALWLERPSWEARSYELMLFENTTNPNRELALYLEIKSRDRDTPLQVRQTIRNAHNEIVLQQQRVWSRHGAVEKIFLPIGTELLPYGSYEVEMALQQGGAHERVVAGFRLAWDDIPRTALHLNHALAAAKYLASEEENQTLQFALTQEALPTKQEILRKFWQAHDTTTTHAVRSAFYQRMVEAEDKFGGERRGWQTDLGRVYLMHGSPDEIEIPSRTSKAQPFQIWRYRARSREFLFIDRKGLGLYQLALGQD